VAFLLLKFGGGLYLLWLAWRTWRGADSPLTLAAPTAAAVSTRPASSTATDGLRHTGTRHFLTALATLLGNPKAAIMYGVIFAALLPPMPTRTLRLALPPSIFVLEGSWYVLVVLALSAPRTRGIYLRAKARIDRICGVVFGLLGLRLLLAAR
jgi:threonine/homoserine/homoserine lactone efflux protein